jgi:hypothetical protein
MSFEKMYNCSMVVIDKTYNGTRSAVRKIIAIASILLGFIVLIGIPAGKLKFSSNIGDQIATAHADAASGCNDSCGSCDCGCGSGCADGCAGNGDAGGGDP